MNTNNSYPRMFIY